MTQPAYRNDRWYRRIANRWRPDADPVGLNSVSTVQVVQNAAYLGSREDAGVATFAFPIAGGVGTHASILVRPIANNPAHLFYVLSAQWEVATGNRVQVTRLTPAEMTALVWTVGPTALGALSRDSTVLVQAQSGTIATAALPALRASLPNWFGAGDAGGLHPTDSIPFRLYTEDGSGYLFNVDMPNVSLIPWIACQGVRNQP